MSSSASARAFECVSLLRHSAVAAVAATTIAAAAASAATFPQSVAFTQGQLEYLGHLYARCRRFKECQGTSWQILSFCPSRPLSCSRVYTRTCVYLPTLLPVHPSAVTGTADRGCCRTVEALEPILCQVVLSLASHWHISFSSLFSRLSSALPITPHLCISLPPQPRLLLWD